MSTFTADQSEMNERVTKLESRLSDLADAVKFADEWLRGLPTMSTSQRLDVHAARVALRTKPVCRELIGDLDAVITPGTVNHE